MAPRITAKVRRIVTIQGVAGDVYAELTAKGITFKARGTKRGVYATWPELASACHTPSDLPRKFQNRPLEFLSHQATEQNKRKAMRLEQQITSEIAQLHAQPQNAETIH
jgi:hypothetical protein